MRRRILERKESSNSVLKQYMQRYLLEVVLGLAIIAVLLAGFVLNTHA